MIQMALSVPRAMLGLFDAPVAGQQLRETAHLAPAHRIGLARERERTASGLADLSGGEMQVEKSERLISS